MSIYKAFAGKQVADKQSGRVQVSLQSPALALIGAFVLFIPLLHKYFFLYP